MQMSEKTTKNQCDTEFVCKLRDMIDKYPQIINWNPQGDKMIIFDIDQMQALAQQLPLVYQAKQLNMYDFHKLYKENKLIAFENQFFRRGNEGNFHFIQRRKRIKQQQLVSLEFQRKHQPLLRRLKKQPKITPAIKQSLHSLLEHKYTAHQNTKSIKQKLETLHSELKQCRSKKINQALKEIRSSIEGNLGQEIKLAREIDGCLEGGFLRQREVGEVGAGGGGGWNEGQQQHQMGAQFYHHLSLITQENKQFTKTLIDYQNLASSGFIPIPSYSYWSANEIPVIHPVYFSNHKLTPQADYSTINAMKQASSQQIIPEAEVGEILNPQQNEKQHPRQSGNKEQQEMLKREAE